MIEHSPQRRVSHWWTVVTVVLTVVAGVLAAPPAPVFAAEPRSTAATCPPADLDRARFPDVDQASVHADAVACLVRWQVTQGRGDGSYGPAAPVTRAQMATFLVRAVRASGGALAGGPDRFGDDGGDAHEANINALAAAGVSLGRGDGSFAPGEPVTRGQMVTFLVRAMRHVLGPAALPPEGDVFDDDDGSPHEEAANAAAAAGVAVGDGSTFRPEAAVTRAQMASFLTRSIDVVVTTTGATPPPDLAPGQTATSFDLADGALLLQAQHVRSQQGSSESGAVVLLAPGAPRPVPGQPVAVEASEQHADGLIGRVQTVSDVSGAVVVRLTPTTLPEVFDSVDVELADVGVGELTAQSQADGWRVISARAISRTVIPRSLLRCESLDRRRPAAELLEDVQIRVTLEDLSVTGDKSARAIQLALSGQLVITLEGTADWDSVRCSIDPLRLRALTFTSVIAAGPVPVTLEGRPFADLTTSAGAQLALGTRIYFNTRVGWNGRPWGATSAHPAAELDLRGYSEADVFGGLDLSVKAWGVLGVYSKTGAAVKAEGHVRNDQACVEVVGAARVEFGMRLDVWVAQEDRRFATVDVRRTLVERCFRPSEAIRPGLPGSPGAGTPATGGSPVPPAEYGGSAAVPAGARAVVTQGAPAPRGYRYAVALRGFAPGSAVSVTCRDSGDPSGFFTFRVPTNSAGDADVGDQCYSADGPEFWVTADGVVSNRARWGGAEGSNGDPAAQPTSATVSLARGPAGPVGFRYAVRANGFPPSATVTVTCHDSVDPQGFYTFTLVTDESGAASTDTQCFSADGPDHWVRANGVESDRVAWGPGASPNPDQEPGTIVGFTVEDVVYGGTWARRDPDDGTWHPRGTQPANAVYWFANGLGVGVDCARSAAAYPVVWVDGRRETWRWWLHVTDGTWIPAAATRQAVVDGPQGLRTC